MDASFFCIGERNGNKYLPHIKFIAKKSKQLHFATYI